MIYAKNQLPNLQKEAITSFDELLLRYLNDQEQNLDSVLNGGLNFTDNFEGKFVTYTTNATPDTEDTVDHPLKKIPTGFFVTDLDKAGIVYRSGTSTETQLLLKCNVASMTVTVFVF